MPKKTKPSKKSDQQIKKLREKLARSLADYSNLEKRINQQRQLFASLATAATIEKMVPILDDLYLVSSHIKEPGLKMVTDKFEKALKEQGLEQIKAKGQVFDPETMDCVDVADGQQDIVVKVRKKGYKLNRHLLRPCQVVVGRPKSKKN